MPAIGDGHFLQYSKCLALCFYGGGHLAHIAGLCGGVSQKAAWWAVHRVTRATKVLKPEFIGMPTDQEYAATAQHLLYRFHLLGFAFVVDCTNVKFEDAPWVMPPNTMTQDFWNRKMIYAIIVQVVGDDEGHILDIVADWQGANIDAQIWNTSGVKQVINRQRQFLIAGDSGYPISATCITLYLVRDAAADPSKRLLNFCHSCTVNSVHRDPVWPHEKEVALSEDAALQVFLGQGDCLRLRSPL
jgi:hypothetical protein